MPRGNWCEGVTVTSLTPAGMASTTSPSASTGTGTTSAPREASSRRGGPYPGVSTATGSPGASSTRATRSTACWVPLVTTTWPGPAWTARAVPTWRAMAWRRPGWPAGSP
jgi:hypothetical protein